MKKIVACLCAVALLASLDWRVSGQVDPETLDSALLLTSDEQAKVLAECLDSVELRSFALPRTLSGPCWVHFRAVAPTLFRGSVEFPSAPQGPIDSLAFKYRQLVSPPSLGIGADELYTAPVGRMTASALPLVITDDIAYELTVQLLADLPATVTDRFDAGYALDRIVAARSFLPVLSHSFAPTYTCYLRLTNGVDSTHIAVSAMSTSSGFGPLIIQD